MPVNISAQVMVLETLVYWLNLGYAQGLVWLKNVPYCRHTPSGCEGKFDIGSCNVTDRYQDIQSVWNRYNVSNWIIIELDSNWVEYWMIKNYDNI